MQKEDCFLFGTVFKLHGYKGSVKIYNDNNNIIKFNTLEYFLIEQNNNLVPHFIKTIKSTQPNIILVNFEDIDCEEKARKINNQKVYLPKSHPTKNNPNDPTKEKLIGYSVVDIHLGDLGTITYINTQTPQKLIYVKKTQKEFCFPMHEEFIKEINSEKEVMTVKVPKELLDLN